MRSFVYAAVSALLMSCGCSEVQQEEEPINIDLNSDRQDRRRDMYGDDPFPELDAGAMSEEEKMRFCLGIHNATDCEFVREYKGIECHVPRSPNRMCLVDGQCILEEVEFMCVYKYYYYDNYVSPAVVNYKIDDAGQVEAMYIPHTIGLVGWEMCDGMQEDSPAVCDCLDRQDEFVAGFCP